MKRSARMTLSLLLLAIVLVTGPAPLEAQCPDNDGDGHTDATCGGDDCDDNDVDRFPGNVEVCGADPTHDEDCDPSTYGELDADADGFTSSVCCNDSNCGPDCDDTRADTHPGASEVCNHNDDDCDGETDENPTSMHTFVFTDGDGDGWGQGLGVPLCPWEIFSSGRVPLTGDCDDSEPAINPEASEACNGVDDNCDGNVDEGFTSQCGS